MTNWQLFVAAAFPTATGLVSIALAIILNGRMEGKIERLDSKIDGVQNVLNSKIDGVANTLNSRMDRMADDLKQFYMILGRHDKAIDMLEKKQAS